MSKMTINGESLGASQQNTLAVELFLQENYQFRRNILNGKVEYVILTPEQADVQPLTASFARASRNRSPRVVLRRTSSR